ncbi:CAP-Gly domain-containing linker protein 4-like isoform X2 [Pristis pectinata]|uniref:CAP-Gly domain-containing linker protein 4-like isoform X2 n=1 Tax=Pristis pectinata TaxID=685728 RepID=UPI00223DFC1A|nr:CAP-Gly domain-containing linker protein 4-like isoform X2 [Pristis pectinata]
MGQSDTQEIEPAEYKEEQQFVFQESPPRVLHQPGQEPLTRPTSAPRNVELPREPIQSYKSTVSREVQVECPKILMQKRCEEQLMETLLLNSRLTEDLGNAWRQIELLRDRLRQSEDICEGQVTEYVSEGGGYISRHRRHQQIWGISENTKQQPEEILSVEHTPHERGTIQRQESMSCDTEPMPTACRCGSQALCQDTGVESYVESRGIREKTNGTELGRGRKLSMNCTVPATEDLLQPRSHNDAPRTRSNYKLISRRNGHDKEIKPLLHFQRQKLPINVNDYVIVNGNKSGTARYVGHLDSSGMANAVFVGIELDEPHGKHDGIFEGKRYFQCYENFAIFVPMHEIFYVINRKPKKSISPPALKSAQHRYSLGSLNSLSNNAGARGEHSHLARKKKQHLPKDLNPTKRILRRSGASSSSRTLDAAATPSQEEWSDGNERTEKASVSPLQPKVNTRAFTITASLPPDFSHYRPVHAASRASPRKVVRR